MRLKMNSGENHVKIYLLCEATNYGFKQTSQTNVFFKSINSKDIRVYRREGSQVVNHLIYYELRVINGVELFDTCRM